LLRETGLVKSTSEARRMIQQGGVRVDGARIDDADLQIATQGEKVLQIGRRRVIRVVFGSPLAS
jgi:tyrosyl-tRNA synthetase